MPSFSAVCSKAELCSAFAQVHVNDLEGALIAHINDMAETKDLLESVVHIASTMVKQGQSDISFSINFPENQMVLSFAKGNYEATPMKDKIYRTFGGKILRQGGFLPEPGRLTTLPQAAIINRTEVGRAAPPWPLHCLAEEIGGGI